MVKIFTKPFAVNGTKETIRDLSQPDGKVSYEDGFTSDYELPDTDPNYRPIERSEFNGILYDVTSAVRALQQAVSGSADALIKTKNLSDLTNKATARTNLGLGSAATSDVVQTTGTSTKNVMSQKAVADAISAVSGSVNAVLLTGNQTVAGTKTFRSFPITPSSAPTANYQTANKKYVDDKVASVSGGGSVNAVLLTGNQTVAGIKTFTSFPVTPSSAPTANYQTANKKYVDDKVASVSGGGSVNAVLLTGNQTVAGIKTFTSFPVTPSSAPTANYQTANKKYVDDKVASVSGGGSVNAVLLTGNQTVAGIKTFTSFPVTPSSAPTANYQTANKKYVDDKVASVSGGGSENAVLLTGNQMIYGIKTFAEFPALPAAIPTSNYQAANKKYVDDKVASVGGSLGVGQTWQDMTGSRVSNVTYTNNTGKPIMVSVSYLSSDHPANTPAIVAYVDSVLVQQISISAGGYFGTVGGAVSFLVPAGASYRAKLAGAELNPVVIWAELR